MRRYNKFWISGQDMSRNSRLNARGRFSPQNACPEIQSFRHFLLFTLQSLLPTHTVVSRQFRLPNAVHQTSAEFRDKGLRAISSTRGRRWQKAGARPRPVRSASINFRLEQYDRTGRAAPRQKERFSGQTRRRTAAACPKNQSLSFSGKRWCFRHHRLETSSEFRDKNFRLESQLLG